MEGPVLCVTRLLPVVFLALGLPPACKYRVLKHSQYVAAGVAEEFVKRAAVDRDFRAAHRMLNENAQRNASEAALAELVKKQHPRGYPVRVRATEYEPVHGQPAIQIFLHGENGSQQFYYRVPVFGTVDKGYYPDGLFIRGDPFPPSALRQKL
jgi:hypothetical protein